MGSTRPMPMKAITQAKATAQTARDCLSRDDTRSSVFLFVGSGGETSEQVDRPLQVGRVQRSPGHLVGEDATVPLAGLGQDGPSVGGELDPVGPGVRGVRDP